MRVQKQNQAWYRDRMKPHSLVVMKRKVMVKEVMVMNANRDLVEWWMRHGGIDLLVPKFYSKIERQLLETIAD